MTLALRQFHGCDTRSTGNKNKNKQLGPHEATSFRPSKTRINTVKRHPVEWQKILANHVFYKGFIILSFVHLATMTVSGSETLQRSQIITLYSYLNPVGQTINPILKFSC